MASSNTRQLRFNGILEANLEKIVKDGIRFNLKKLDQCSHNIAKFKANKQENELRREYMNGRQLIQQLQANLNDLKNCLISLQEVELDKKYTKLIDTLHSEVNGRISSFTSANEAINYKFNDTDEVLCNQQSSNYDDSSHSTNYGLQIQQEAASLSDSKERFRKVESLNQDIQELNSLAVNLASLVREHQEPVNNIENNVCNTEQNIEDGTKTLIKASTISVAPITCAALGGAVFGPVGALVGFKFSTGVMSALGASAFTYSVAKYLQNRKKEECLEDLDSISRK